MSASREVDVGDIDVAATLRGLAMYSRDPSHRWLPNGFAKAIHTPDGPGSMRITWGKERVVAAEAHGAGAEWLLERVPDWVGLTDDPSDFEPVEDPRLHDLWRRNRNVRLARLGVIWQELLLVIIGQRVSSDQVIRSWYQLCKRWGQPAPGPDQLMLPPSPSVLGQLKYYELHKIGIERRRADAMVTAAKRANRLEEAAEMNGPDAVVRLSALPGLGMWTATATVIATHADPDIVMLGDYGMPTLVNYFFAGDAKRLPPEPDGDRIMLEHLAPWAGNRQRVMRLLFASGVHPPRRAPRARNPDIRHL